VIKEALDGVFGNWEIGDKRGGRWENWTNKWEIGSREITGSNKNGRKSKLRLGAGRSGEIKVGDSDPPSRASLKKRK